MRDAEHAKHAENYEEALDLLDRAMEVADDLENTRYVLTLALKQADILIEMKRYDHAETVLHTLINSTSMDIQPETHLQAQISLSYSDLMQGKLEVARQRLETLRTLAKDHHARWRIEGYLARAYLLEGNSSYALRLLTDPQLSSYGGIANDPESNALFSIWLAEIYRDSQQLDLCQLHLERALNLATKYHLRKYQREVSLTLAQIQLQRDDAESAYEHLLRSLALIRQSQIQQNFEIHLQLSRASLLTQRQAEALFHAEAALERSQQLKDDAHLKATLHYVDVLTRIGRTEDALHILEEAQRTASEPIHQEQLAFRLGLIQIQTQHYSQALPLLQEVHSHTADPAMQYQLDEFLGLIYLKLGQPDLTLKHWSIATKNDTPTITAEKHARLWIQLAQLRYQVGQPTRAYKEMEHALVLLGRTEDIVTRGIVVSNAAILLHERGEVESARSFLEESLALARLLEQPNLIATRVGNLGRVMVDVGQTRLALPLLEEAVECANQHQLMLISAIHTNNLGVAYAQLSQYKTALDYHRQASEKLEGCALQADEAHWQVLIKVDCAHVLLSLARYDEARSLLEDTYANAPSLLHYPTRLHLLNALARLNLLEKQLEQAESYLQQSLNLARQADYKRLLAQGLMLHSELLALRHQYPLAQTAWEEAKSLYTTLQSPLARQSVSWLKG